MTKYKYLFIILLYLQIGHVKSQSLHIDSTSLVQTNLSGILVDDQGIPVILGTVALYQKGKLIIGIETDFDGYYLFTKMAPGLYDIEFSGVGFHSLKIEDITIRKNINNRIDAQMERGPTIPFCNLSNFQKPLIELDNMTSGSIYTKEEISHAPY